MKFKPSAKLLILSTFTFILLSGCNPVSQEVSRDSVPGDTLGVKVVQSYAQIVYLTYKDSLAAAELMHDRISSFTNDPSPDSLNTARKSWVASRLPYLQSEVFRFYDGPIDDEDGPEGLLNAWPMDEAYLDYVKGFPNSGIVNNPSSFPKITTSLIAQLNEKDGEENISSGFHAIEFLLWGQDFDEDGPGNRPHTDYTTGPNAERRKEYLLAATELLIENLQGLVAEWKPNSDNYRKSFEQDKPEESLKKILTGLCLLTGFELAGERLLVAHDSKSQEDEHSCFSDTTHNDIEYDIIGIANVWHGRYKGVDETTFEGKGIRDFLTSKSPKKTALVDQLIKTASNRFSNIPVPFDQAILQPAGSDSSKSILALIDTLEDTADLLVDIGAVHGFNVPRELEE